MDSVLALPVRGSYSAIHDCKPSNKTWFTRVVFSGSIRLQAYWTTTHCKWDIRNLQIISHCGKILLWKNIVVKDMLYAQHFFRKHVDDCSCRSCWQFFSEEHWWSYLSLIVPSNPLFQFFKYLCSFLCFNNFSLIIFF